MTPKEQQIAAVKALPDDISEELLEKAMRHYCDMVYWYKRDNPEAVILPQEEIDRFLDEYCG